MNEVIALLKDFGFPAVMCGMFFWLCNVTINKNTRALDRLFVLIKMLYDKSNNKL